jgi:hypothetical protein
MESVPSSSQLPGRHGFGTQAPENRYDCIVIVATIAFDDFFPSP